MNIARATMIAAGLSLVGLTGLNLSNAQQASTGTDIKWSMTDYAFKPQQTKLKVGVPVKITVTNDGKEEHEFYVYETPKTEPKDWEEHAITNTFFKDTGEVKVYANGVKVAGHSMFEFVLQTGQNLRLEFTPTRKGTYQIGCHLPGHYENGMKGVLVVE
jgi:uncharacterized cupredoxin-like copper-binding protein